MANEIGNENPQNNDNLNQLLDIKVEELDETALREKLTEIIPKYKETSQSNKQLFERAKSAEGGLKELKEKLKTLETPAEPNKVAPDAKTGELTDAVLDFFELKGYNDPEQIQVLESVMKKTGMSHREVLKDEYAMSKIEAIKKQKEVLAATPSSTRRTPSGASSELDYWKAKYEQDGSLPDDFTLRSAVINAKVEKERGNKPAWHK